MNVLMVRSPLLGLEGVEALACSEAAAIIAAGKPAAAAIPAPPTRTRRRDGKKRAGMTELSSVVGLTVDICRSSQNRAVRNGWRSRRVRRRQSQFAAVRVGFP